MSTGQVKWTCFKCSKTVCLSAETPPFPSCPFCQALQPGAELQQTGALVPPTDDEQEPTGQPSQNGHEAVDRSTICKSEPTECPKCGAASVLPDGSGCESCAQSSKPPASASQPDVQLELNEESFQETTSEQQQTEQSNSCVECEIEFPATAKYCPKCGKPPPRNIPQGPPCAFCEKPLLKTNAILCNSCGRRQPMGPQPKPPDSTQAATAQSGATPQSVPATDNSRSEMIVPRHPPYKYAKVFGQEAEPHTSSKEAQPTADGAVAKASNVPYTARPSSGPSTKNLNRSSSNGGSASLQQASDSTSVDPNGSTTNGTVNEKSKPKLDDNSNKHLSTSGQGKQPPSSTQATADTTADVQDHIDKKNSHSAGATNSGEKSYASVAAQGAKVSIPIYGGMGHVTTYMHQN